MPLPDPAVWTDAEPLECGCVVPEASSTATISFVAPDGALISDDIGEGYILACRSRPIGRVTIEA